MAKLKLKSIFSWTCAVGALRLYGMNPKLEVLPAPKYGKNEKACPPLAGRICEKQY